MFRRKKTPSRWPTKLMRLIRARDWSAVRRRLASHPSEAAIRGPIGPGPLGEAVRHCHRDPPPPLDVIESLAAANPDAIGTYSDYVGMTPLHMLYDVAGIGAPPPTAAVVAASHCADERPLQTLRGEILRVLLRANPLAARVRDEFGRTPLMAAFEANAMDLAEAEIAALTEVQRTQLLETSLEEKEVGGGRIQVENRADMAARWISDAGLSLWWEEVTLLLWTEHLGEAASGQTFATPGPVRTTPRFPLIHACAAVESCPIQLLRFAALAFPDELSRRDGDGNLPLHVALKCRQDSEGGRRSLFVGNELSNAVDALLRACPSAASTPDGEGRLPLALAVEAGLPWERGSLGCLKCLMEAEPRALRTIDKATFMYPFMLCACSEVCSITVPPPKADGNVADCEHNAVTVPDANESKVSSNDHGRLTTLYQLLLTDPSMLHA